MTCTDNTIRLNDIGTIFVITIEEDDVAVDISSYTPLQLIFLSPDGDRKEKTATFTTDGTDGKIQYTTIAGDIDAIGSWQIQGIVGTFHSSIGSFTVQRNL